MSLDVSRDPRIGWELFQVEHKSKDIMPLKAGEYIYSGHVNKGWKQQGDL
jgi:hypothetical protein